MWIKASDYQAEMYEKALVWAKGWDKPCAATFMQAATTDGRGNDVAQHTGWLLDSVGAFYEDFGYFGDWELKYYGIDAAQYVLPMSSIELPTGD